MAKTSKAEKSDRQKVIDDIRRKQRSAEKRQGRLIVGVCVVAAAVIIGLAAWKPLLTAIEKQRQDTKPLDEIGASADVCEKPETKPANGNQEHVPTGTPVEYEEAPPAFGPHWNEAGEAPAPIEDRFYSEDSRPPLEGLVHNLEHGYTILWYDESAADNPTTVGQIKAIADKLNDSDTNFRLKFKAVPWTKDDGKAFPDGQHIAFTHWTADDQGVWQFCSEPSGEALEQFMIDYPFSDSPEPRAG